MGEFPQPEPILLKILHPFQAHVFLLGAFIQPEQADLDKCYVFQNVFPLVTDGQSEPGSELGPP